VNAIAAGLRHSEVPPCTRLGVESLFFVLFTNVSAPARPTVLNRENPPATVRQDRRTIEFPLPVRQLHLEDSQKFRQLEVAGLIASAARAHASGLVMGCSSFLDAVLHAGLYEALAGGVWPTNLLPLQTVIRKALSSAILPPTSRVSRNRSSLNRCSVTTFRVS
jgi:hypothetical protein